MQYEHFENEIDVSWTMLVHVCSIIKCTTEKRGTIFIIKLGTISKFDGNSLSLQMLILSCKDSESWSFATNAIQVLPRYKKFKSWSTANAQRLTPLEINTVQVLECWQTDGRTDRQTDWRYQIYCLPCFAVDKNLGPSPWLWLSVTDWSSSYYLCIFMILLKNVTQQDVINFNQFTNRHISRIFHSLFTSTKLSELQFLEFIFLPAWKMWVYWIILPFVVFAHH